MHTHIFTPDEIREGYEICECGTYHSLKLLSPDELYLHGYWGPEHGRSTMDEQVSNLSEYNIDGDTKIDCVLKYAIGHTLLEIGCAPGILLKKATGLGFDCGGIEPDINNVLDIYKICGPGPKIVSGFFPGRFKHWKDRYDTIVAMDVVEHIEDYDDFIRSAHGLLNEGGRFIFMSPIIYEDGKCRDRDFTAREHAWIFSKTYLLSYLSIFSNVKFDRWIVGHEIVVCIK
jgi:cyclopropane fatty-acyl-phospholipid synthase-like methyltransferase